MNEQVEQVPPKPTDTESNKKNPSPEPTPSTSTQPEPAKQPKSHPMEELIEDLKKFIQDVQNALFHIDKVTDWAEDKVQTGINKTKDFLSDQKDNLVNKINQSIDNLSDFVDKKQQETKDDPQRQATDEELKEAGKLVKDVSDSTNQLTGINTLTAGASNSFDLSPPQSSKSPDMAPVSADSLPQSTPTSPTPAPSQNNDDTPQGPEFK